MIDDNEPNFTEEELQPEAYEAYEHWSTWALQYCREASIGEELMPTEKCGSDREGETDWMAYCKV